MTKIGFDNEKYLHLQSQKILERIALFGGKLYLEFAEAFDDYMLQGCSGFQAGSKVKMLLELKDQAEIVITHQRR